MSGLLNWGPAEREDRLALEAFTCTEPGRSVKRGGRWGISHDRPWELVVQSRIRHIHPPAQPPDFCLIGCDEAGIGAVVFYDEIDQAGQVEIRVVAVSSRFRRRGGGWADEMVTETLDALTTRAIQTGVSFVYVTTWIAEGNRPSQRLFRRFGFRQVAEAEHEDLQRWAMKLDLADAYAD